MTTEELYKQIREVAAMFDDITSNDEIPKNIVRNISFDILCKNCGSIRMLNVPLSIPSEIYLGVNQFKEMLAQMHLECFSCGEQERFDLIKTEGLDEDLIPQISIYEKKEWYNSLDFIFQHYLGQIFNIDDFSSANKILLFECRLILEKLFEEKNGNEKVVLYKIDAIALQDGQNKMITDNYPLVFIISSEKELSNQVIINPQKYVIEEKSIKLLGGKTYQFPVLKQK